MKHEWRKKEKNIYIPKVVPSIIDIQSMKYFTIEGVGNPNSDNFSEDIRTLYSIPYGVRMAPKAGMTIENYFEYTVYPLEGLWDLSTKGIELYNLGIPITELKDYLTYKLMIRQPDFVNEEIFETFKNLTFKKTNNKKIFETKFEKIEEGLSCQMLHLGSYDNEHNSFKEMEKYIKENGYERISKVHKEIYITDARKVVEEKLKTTLRFKIRRKI